LLPALPSPACHRAASTNRLFLARALKRLFPGAEVLAAPDGKQGVDVVAARMAAGVGVPSFITMDRDMPVLSGTEAVEALRRMGYEGLIVGVTGSALMEERQEFVEAGADTVMSKPINVESLVELVLSRIVPPPEGVGAALP
jgi:CheY-like chemotaxis protein